MTGCLLIKMNFKLDCHVPSLCEVVVVVGGGSRIGGGQYVVELELGTSSVKSQVA